MHQIDKRHEDPDDDYFKYSLETGKSDDWPVQLLVNDVKPFNVKIDTGAQCYVLSLKACKRANNNTKQFLRSNSRLVSYSGHAVETCGKVQTTVRHKDQYFGLELQIVDDDVQPVLGLKSSLDLNLLHRVYTVNKNQGTESVKELINEYDHLFKGMGCLPGKYDIKVYPTVPPVVASPRRIPHTLKLKILEERQRMETSKIMSKVETPTQWVSPIVVVKKQNGQIEDLFGSTRTE